MPSKYRTEQIFQILYNLKKRTLSLRCLRTKERSNNFLLPYQFTGRKVCCLFESQKYVNRKQPQHDHASNRHLRNTNPMQFNAR